jgi:hypothetical protein
MVQSALQYFDKNLTLDHLENHTDYLYLYRKGGNPKDHFKVCWLCTTRVVRAQETEETEDPSGLTDRGILD